MTTDYENDSSTHMHAEDELVPFDVRDYSDRRSMRLLIGLIIGLLLIAAFLFKTYYSGTRDRNAPPTISAEKTPYKVTPENPGGEETPNQDMKVYDVMNGTLDETNVNAQAGAETPVDLPDKATIVVNRSDTRPVSQDDIPAPTPVEQKTDTVNPTPTVKTPIQTTTPAPAGETVNGQSAWVVQVASLRSEPEARATWMKLKTDFATLLPNGAYGDVRRVDLNEKGIYYRLRIAGLSDKASASRLCSGFKGRGQSCFVTKF